MLEDADVVAARDDLLGQQEPERQLAIGAGRPHDDRERLPVQPDLERLLDDRAVGRGGRFLAAHAHDVDRRQRFLATRPVHRT